MNGRFSRLELGSHEEQPEDSSNQTFRATDKQLQGTATRSTDHYLANARTAQRRGEFESALQLFTRALREDRTRVAAWVGQVQMLIDLGEYAEARLWSDKSLEVFRLNGDLLAAKSIACLRQGDSTAAQVCSDSSIQAVGSSPLRWCARGELMLSKAESRARDCFEKALTESTSDWFDRVVVARVYLFHEKPAAASDFAALATGMAPSEPFAWTIRARCQFGLGDNSRAEESCRRALELDPRFSLARDLLVTIGSSGSGGIFRRLKGWFER